MHVILIIWITLANLNYDIIKEKCLYHDDGHHHCQSWVWGIELRETFFWGCEVALRAFDRKRANCFNKEKH